jgi:predicted transcriptional regulator
VGELVSGEQEHYFLTEPIPNPDKIIRLLKDNKSGLTITEISNLLDVSRNTAVVSLAWLEGADRIRIRRVGMAKIYSLKSDVQTKLEVEKE